MKNRKWIVALCATTMIGMLAGCGQKTAETATNQEATTAEATEAEETPIEEYEYYNANYNKDFVYSISGISDLKRKEATQQGTVESMQYETPAYAINAVTGGDHTITKSLNVYLPYGYDASKQYNVLYLMHGGGDDQEFWLGEGSDRVHGQTTRNVLDHMIEDGLCDPVIVVTPTFYSTVEGVEPTEDQIKAVVDQLGEDNYSTIDDLYTWYFQYEIRDQIIPVVEAKYSTYAGGNVTPENLIASRDHRAYDGLSMGSLTSMHSILMGNLDYISYIGSFSGAKTNVELFKKTIDEKFADYKVNYWFNGEGVDDIAFEEHYKFYYDVMEQMGDKFKDGENSAMVVLSDGMHVYSAWIADLYNSLLVFFK